MKEEQAKVYTAINAVQNALKVGIPKDQKNAVQGYNFRGIDDIYNVVGPLLPDHGLVIIPKMKSWHCEQLKNAKGNTLFHVNVEAEYHFVSSADGSREVVTMFGEAMDSSDKATNKAMSAAYKYACIQTFSIPVTGEPDADADTPELAVEIPVRHNHLPQPPKGSPRAPQHKEEAPAGTATRWQGYITDAHPYNGPPPGKPGKPYTVYFLTLKDGNQTHEAGTYDEGIYQKAKTWENVDEEVIVWYKPGRQDGKYEFLDVQPVTEFIEDNENP